MYRRLNHLLIDFFSPQTLTESSADLSLLHYKVQIVSFNILSAIFFFYSDNITTFSPSNPTVIVFPIICATCIFANIYLKLRGKVIGPQLILAVLYPIAFIRLPVAGGLAAPGLPSLFLLPIICIFMNNHRISIATTLLSSILFFYLADQGPEMKKAIVYTLFLIAMFSSCYYVNYKYNQLHILNTKNEQVKSSTLVINQICHEVNNPICILQGRLLSAKKKSKIDVDVYTDLNQQLVRISHMLKTIRKYSETGNIIDILKKSDLPVIDIVSSIESIPLSKD